MMKAAVIREAGGPEALKIEQLPVPKPQPGWVLIRVNAFGFNRLEMYIRKVRPIRICAVLRC
jgi:NADPH:quinone reductase-like Zn-dependent oxidoreductase